MAVSSDEASLVIRVALWLWRAIFGKKPKLTHLSVSPRLVRQDQYTAREKELYEHGGVQFPQVLKIEFINNTGMTLCITNMVFVPRRRLFPWIWLKTGLQVLTGAAMLPQFRKQPAYELKFAPADPSKREFLRDEMLRDHSRAETIVPLAEAESIPTELKRGTLFFDYYQFGGRSGSKWLPV